MCGPDTRGSSPRLRLHLTTAPTCGTVVAMKPMEGMKRTPAEVLLDMVSAMADRVEDEALSEAYAELYQALGALLLQEDEEKVREEAAALLEGARFERPMAVLKALERIYKLSPMDYEVVLSAVGRTMSYIAFENEEDDVEEE